jgi:hypothetical protein
MFPTTEAIISPTDVSLNTPQYYHGLPNQGVERLQGGQRSASGFADANNIGASTIEERGGLR